MIIALQIVKDNILIGACIMKVSVNKQLLSFVKSARQIYEWDLEVKQKLFQGEKLKHTKKENEELVELSVMTVEIKLRQRGLVPAEQY